MRGHHEPDEAEGTIYGLQGIWLLNLYTCKDFQSLQGSTPVGFRDFFSPCRSLLFNLAALFFLTGSSLFLPPFHFLGVTWHSFSKLFLMVSVFGSEVTCR